MNENTGFVCCPACKMPWDTEQWCCSYCGGTETPAALRMAGPAWAWQMAGAALLLAVAADLSFGGHVIRFLRSCLESIPR